MYRLLLTFLCAATLTACGGADKSSDEPAQPDDDDERGDTRISKVPDIDDDDDDDDGDISIEGLRGRMSVQDIESGIKPHQNELMECYTSRVRSKTHIGGDVEIKWEIGRDGMVKWVQLVESDLGAWPIERCMLEVSQQMSFPKPKGGDADFSVPLGFEATRGVLWWSADKGEEAVAEVLPQLSECAGRAGTSNPSNVFATIYVGVRGTVMGAGFASPENDPIPLEWADCAEEVVKTWTLHDPQGKIAKAGFRYNP
jgi:hypothetical protein